LKIALLGPRRKRGGEGLAFPQETAEKSVFSVLWPAVGEAGTTFA
jgi:hypothetical protein